MKIGVNLGIFPQDVPLQTQLEAAKEAGCDGVELNIAEEGELSLKSSSDELKSIAQAARDLGLEIPSVHCGLHWKYTLTDADPQVRQKSRDVLERALEVGSEVGAEVLLVVPGVVNEEVSYADAYARAQEGVAALGEKAQAVNMTVGVENVWNKFLLSPLEMRRFIDEIDHPAVGAYFDVGNILAYGYPHHWIETLSDTIFAVHLKDYRLDVAGHGGFVYLGQGDVPWEKVQTALKEIGYDGYVTAELPPYRYKPMATVKDVVQSMRRVMNL